MHTSNKGNGMFKELATAAFVTAAAVFTGGVIDNPTPVVMDTPIMEDSPEWNCATMGNRVCGPSSLTPGCFNDNEEMVAPWPCFVVVDDDGNADVYTVRNVKMWSE